MSTPDILGIAKGTCIPPEGGWKDQTYYVVDLAWRSVNVIHRAILYVGFVPREPFYGKHAPRFPDLAGGYTSLMQDEGSARDNGLLNLQHAHYIKAIAAIPGIGALDKEK